ncbi:MAG: mandelate racemase/muconate lactonizing enzyme family protein [Bifidobacteriaceae bacterium]|jgi:L-alanine-DL-glutamate epimerase-like enolase superfamily enzyme|nr:mandelate racemase/muconate lactonizing enzyme family protein [Bifidobacteriaceae bacterium]
MRVESVDPYYLAMPEITDVGDGSQDMLLVRVQVGGAVGWGECEASPLTSLAAMVTPPSHSACRPVLEAVLGEQLDSPTDIARIARRVTERCFDLLQADHAWSGIEIALWDALGKALDKPVRALMGMGASQGAWTPYASVLFGEDAAETRQKAERIAAAGFSAAKFGWARFGSGSPDQDREQIRAARLGLGHRATLMVDAGTVFGEDVGAAAARLPALEESQVTWLEEPFSAGALDCYAQLSRLGRSVAIAGGEGSHNATQAINLMTHGRVTYIQVDTGRIGGIGPARVVALKARSLGREYVNHTFTSHLALASSLHPFADWPEGGMAEYPLELSLLARNLVPRPIELCQDGLIRLPDGPGLGIRLDIDAVRPFLREVTITVGEDPVYSTPPLLP